MQNKEINSFLKDFVSPDSHELLKKLMFMGCQ